MTDVQFTDNKIRKKIMFSRKTLFINILYKFNLWYFDIYV